MTELADNDGTALIHRPSGGAPRHGVVLRLHISDRFYGTEIQVAAAATSDATVPLTTFFSRASSL